MDNPVILQMKGITKRFGSKVIANNNVDLDLRKGEVLAILGENGSGKTTLMNMLIGIYRQDEGQIFINGKEVEILSPKDAYKHKIGMVHQHFKLIDVFTAADNVILGEKAPDFSVVEQAKLIKENAEKQNQQADNYDPDEHAGVLSYLKAPKKQSKLSTAMKIAALPFKKIANKLQFGWLRKNRAKDLQSIANKYGFDIDLNEKIYNLSVSEKQAVEIIKVLYRGADILILDEPTAVLTPQEIEKLFNVVRNMRADGKSIIIITHKLNEVMEISDRVAVLRKGEHIATVETAQTDEKQLTEMMVGKKIDLNIDRTTPHDVEDRLVVYHLNAINHEGVKVLDDVSFTARSGEILGIAGIAGSGQKELLEAIAGLQKLNSGDIIYYDPTKNNEEVDLRSKTPVQIRELGVRLSFVPEDRLGMGLVGNMDITDNMMLRSYRKGIPVFLDRKNPKELAERIISELQVSTPSTSTPVRRLSGGNVQKVLVGREIAAAPTVLMAAYPVRGLDINSSYTIYNLLNEQKEKGVAVIFVGEDLDVLIDLCDRIMVLCGGKVSGIVDARAVKKEQLGLLMVKRDDMTPDPEEEVDGE
ncbi:MAG: ABC transporter ATP-binding protein [Christensenellales bacterium]